MTTQKDIARVCEVSVSVVSRALSGKAAEIGIPDETVERVLKTASEMGYVPNVTARILKGAATRTLGVAVADFEDPYLGPMIGQLQRLAHQRDYSLVLEALSESSALVKHAIDGLVIAGSCEQLDWARSLLDRGIPAVCIGRSPDAERMQSIAVDEDAGFRMLVAHLVERGHERIGFIGGPDPVHRRREAAVRSVHALPEKWIARSDRKLSEGGHQAMSELLARGGEPPSAIIAASDMRAVGAIRAAADAGLRLPDQLAITGFDDIPIAASTVPSLTTIRQPVLEMTRLAFDQVTNPPGTGSVLLSPQLVIREST